MLNPMEKFNVDSLRVICSHYWHDDVWSKVIAGVFVLIIGKIFSKKIFPRQYKNTINYILCLFPQKFTLQSIQLKIQNESTFKKIFSLNKCYCIKITPDNTLQWRGGIRLSKDNIFPPLDKERHGNSNYPDIHIAVGERAQSGNWGNQNKIYLCNYHLQTEHILLSPLNTYLPNSTLEFRIYYNKRLKTTEFSIQYGNEKEEKTKSFPLSEFKYFKIMAWADEINYKLNFKVTRFIV